MLLSAACSPSLLSPCMAAPSVRAVAGSCAEQVTPVPHNVPVKLALTRQAWQQRWNMLSRALPWNSQALLPAVSSGRAGQTRCWEPPPVLLDYSSARQAGLPCPSCRHVGPYGAEHSSPGSVGSAWAQPRSSGGDQPCSQRESCARSLPVPLLRLALGTRARGSFVHASRGRRSPMLLLCNAELRDMPLW